MSTPTNSGVGEPQDADVAGSNSSLLDDPTDVGSDAEENLQNVGDLMSADRDPLPDEEVTDPNSTPQGPP